MNPTRIEVTAEDIRRGERMSCSSCPIARAARRALGRPVAVLWKVWDRMSGDEFGCLPDEARTFIRRFDGGRPVEPFAFDLIPPEGGAVA